MTVNGINGTGTVHNQIVGAVEQVNDKGVKIGGEWRNFSKFAPDLVPPSRGQRVTVQLDKSGFVRSIEAATDTHHGPVAGRETAIIRQTCVKASAAFCASRPELKSAADALTHV